MISERAFRMNFEEFQNQSRFYVVGALELGEVEEFEREREKFGKRLKTSLHNVMPCMKHSRLSLRGRTSYTCMTSDFETSGAPVAFVVCLESSSFWAK
jgi:hypothetical protein